MSTIVYNKTTEQVCGCAKGDLFTVPPSAGRKLGQYETSPKRATEMAELHKDKLTLDRSEALGARGYFNPVFMHHHLEAVSKMTASEQSAVLKFLSAGTVDPKEVESVPYAIWQWMTEEHELGVFKGNLPEPPEAPKSKAEAPKEAKAATSAKTDSDSSDLFQSKK